MSLLLALLIAVIGAGLSFAGCEWLLSHAVARAHEKGILDHPTERGSHDIPTPRVGGQAIVPVVIASAWIVLIARAVGHTEAPSFVSGGLWGIILGGAVAAFIGYRDDVETLRVGPKFGGQLIAAFLVATLAGRFNGLALAGFGVGVSPLVMMLLTWVGVAVLMNVVNFMDGMDGLVSVFAFTCLAGFALQACASPAGGEMALVLAAFTGALVAFHRRNVTEIHEKKTFLGDCGSQFMGLALAVLPLILSRNRVTGFVDATPAAILFYPFLFDTALTVTRRASRGSNIFQAHHEHLYQRQLELGDSHARVRGAWVRILLIHLALAGVCILSGSGSILGRLALLATPVPMAFYCARVLRRESQSAGVAGRG
jgi:UDP-N-acetylmuramyl pentapeptide phosphotransferase/UDP-N-acetylglucosamine-1-phosphate transferase